MQQKTVLGNIPVVETGYSEVKQYIQQHGKIEQRKIKAVTLRPDHILHCPVDTEHPERLNQEIEGNQKDKIGQEFTLQYSTI